LVNEKKTFRTNIAINGPYDTRLNKSNTVQCHMDYSQQRWSEVFFFIHLNVCYYR